MRYDAVRRARFVRRLNRFTAIVRLEGGEETVHVKNTGRLGELLVPEAAVVLAEAAAPGRKTAYDLIGVYRGGRLFNIDSQAPNKVVGEWLVGQGFDVIRPEYTYGQSRVDFYMEKGGRRYLMEVKGCTLDIGGVGYFPDAPTERGVRHLRELTAALDEGYEACLAFVIQMAGVDRVEPYRERHPAFADACEEAEAKGLRVLHLTTRPAEDSLEITTPPVFL
ncbi:MAG: DNA/RNA nuclease SfsA [Lachnospiraceae bacterium]|nr:DNA/RNA nuclease SfsA [Lachnospiraceae bacterium]